MRPSTLAAGENGRADIESAPTYNKKYRPRMNFPRAVLLYRQYVIIIP